MAWIEEPVASDDLVGRRLVRRSVPAGMDVATGEQGREPTCFRRLLEADAVDVMQADAMRCGGVTGFMLAASLSVPCAPALDCHLGMRAPRFRQFERFHDHLRIGHALFDGAPMPHDGAFAPDMGQPGPGLVFKEQDARRFAVETGS